MLSRALAASKNGSCEPDVGAKVLVSDHLQRDPVDLDAAGLWSIKSQQQRQQCRLAAARVPDDADETSGQYVDADIVQHRLVRVIAEADIGQLHVPASHTPLVQNAL